MRCSRENGECNLNNYRNSGKRRDGDPQFPPARLPFDMKNLKRLVLGVLSSLLFTVGFARVADQLDPMSQSLPQNSTASTTSTTPDCSSLCDIV
jgi:hypothetical protein